MFLIIFTKFLNHMYLLGSEISIKSLIQLSIITLIKIIIYKLIAQWRVEFFSRNNNTVLDTLEFLLIVTTLWKIHQEYGSSKQKEAQKKKKTRDILKQII